ncbi:MAG: endonuclease/exonuclease/phosphatase family protein [Deltaproteobacteria bacterium]|nr:endonuclease/exonuclease/phosphatase family protein [Deltaproteobacteria bacterium]
MARLSIALLTIASLFFGPSRSKAQEFNVFTMNLWRGQSVSCLSANPTDCEHGSAPRVGSLAGALTTADFVAIKDFGRESILSLQEVDKHTSRAGGIDVAWEIDDALSPGWANYFGSAMPYQGGQYGSAAVMSVAASQSATWQLDNPDPSTESEPRIAVTTRHDFGSGKELWVVNLHLDHLRTHRWGAERRWGAYYQFLSLLDWLDGLDPDTPTVLNGDFNLSQSADPVLFSWVESALASRGYSRVATWNVDHVFVRNPGGQLSVLYTIDYNPYHQGVTLSDHRWIKTVFRWN